MLFHGELRWNQVIVPVITECPADFDHIPGHFNRGGFLEHPAPEFPADKRKNDHADSGGDGKIHGIHLERQIRHIRRCHQAGEGGQAIGQFVPFRREILRRDAKAGDIILPVRDHGRAGPAAQQFFYGLLLRWRQNRSFLAIQGTTSNSPLNGASW